MDNRREQNMEPSEKKTISTAKIALIFEASAIAAAFFAWLVFLIGSGLLLLVFFLLCLWVVIASIVGIIMGIAALFDKNKTRSDRFCAIAAILLPPLAVLVLILLFSAGVIVIRFM